MVQINIFDSLYEFYNPGIQPIGLPTEEGGKVYEEIKNFMLSDQFIYRHKWQAGDTVVWDNRRVMHNAETYDMERYTRHMHRSCIHGDRPF